MQIKRGEIVKIILKGMLIAGAIPLFMTSSNPRLASRLFPELIKYAAYKLKKRKNKKEIYDMFYYLKRKGLIKMNYEGKQLYISLTPEGRKIAKKYQIDDLEIKKPRKWDKRWRILIFDINDKYKDKREALRGKLKELGLFMLQKSVWVCPYNFQKEIEILRTFFALQKKEMKVINAYEIEDDEVIKDFFKMK